MALHLSIIDTILYSAALDAVISMVMKSICCLLLIWPVRAVGKSIRSNVNTNIIAEENSEPQWFWNFSASAASEHKIWGETTNEMYGSSVSIWDNLMLVGAQGDISGKYQTGAAYVYFKYGTANSEWQLFYTLQPDDGQDGDRFGCAVSLGDHTAVIGASHHDALGQDSGAAYLYERLLYPTPNSASHQDILEYNDQSHLTFIMKLVPEDGSGQDYFGSAVATHINTTVVGAWGCDMLGTLAGCVYVWRKHFLDTAEGEWTFKQKVVATDGRGYQRFGTSVSIYKDVIVVGAPGDADLLGNEVGAAYVFDQLFDDSVYDGRSWQEHAKLSPTDGGHYDLYGQAVSVWEDSILVGAPHHTVIRKKHSISSAGTVYSYTQTVNQRYFLIEEIEPYTPLENGRFGQSVDIYDHMAAIGETPEGGPGSVYIYREDGQEVHGTTIGHWIFDAQRKSSQGVTDDMYGYCVSLYGPNLAVGAYGTSMDTTGGNSVYNNGGVYLYTGAYAIVTEPVVTKESSALDMTLVVLAACMSLVGISCIALICMYQDFKNGLSKNIDSIQYELAHLDTSHGMGSVLIAPSNHGDRGGNRPLGRIDAVPRNGTSSSTQAGPAINPLHVNHSLTTPVKTVDRLDEGNGTMLDVSLNGASGHNGEESFRTRSRYGPPQDVMDASIREGTKNRGGRKGNYGQ